MPLVMEQPELAYDDNLIRAQTVGTIQSLVDTGRKVVLITADSTADAAAADLRRFFNRVDIVLRGAEGKDGGVVTGQAINVLSTLFSLQEGAQTGGYNIEHAIMEGADGFILNHSEPRGRMENKMENLLRGVRDLLNQKASPATIEKLWVATLKTENLSDEQIAEMRTILDGFTGNRRTQSAIELRARQLVNKVVNFQLKKIVAYSDKYTFRQVVLCVGETRRAERFGVDPTGAGPGYQRDTGRYHCGAGSPHQSAPGIRASLGYQPETGDHSRSAERYPTYAPVHQGYDQPCASF
jgi:hypothetical protein